MRLKCRQCGQVHDAKDACPALRTADKPLRTVTHTVQAVTHKNKPNTPKSNKQRQREWRERNMNKQLTLQRERMTRLRDTS